MDFTINLNYLQFSNTFESDLSPPPKKIIRPFLIGVVAVTYFIIGTATEGTYNSNPCENIRRESRDFYVYWTNISNYNGRNPQCGLPANHPSLPSNTVCNGVNENDPRKGIVEIEVETDRYKCYDFKRQRAFSNAAGNTTTVSDIPIGANLIVTLTYYEACGRCDNFNQQFIRDYRVAYTSITFFLASEIINNSTLQLNVPTKSNQYYYNCP